MLSAFDHVAFPYLIMALQVSSRRHAGSGRGRYSLPTVSVKYGSALPPPLGNRKDGLGRSFGRGNPCRAISTGLAGLVVGVPSRRLKGDYLAIRDSGFGQIIVVFLII